jgi:hypothetical protein
VKTAPHGPWRPATVGLALFASFGPSCGGTTGLEKIVADPMTSEAGGDGASDAKGNDPSAQEPFAVAQVDATAPVDSAAVSDDTEPLDAAAGALGATADDRTVPERPPPRDGGSPPTGGAVRRMADSAPPPPDAAPPTTLAILAAQSPGCIRMVSGDAGTSVATGCAVTSGCLDPAAQGGVCELSGGSIPDGQGHGLAPLDPPGSPGYTADCLHALGDIFASHCAESALGLTPCVCGNVDMGGATACLQGITPPMGPLVADYLESFAPQAKNVVGEIEAHFTNQAYGAGQANAMIQCLAQFNCGCCFAGDAGCGD